ncbi:MAG TPA: D-2-hydroxyacid dehydrogenase [Vicinamibacteria bacterium]|nr:D-2-hydroxyacid dehydrogenase [Vicinamibacteria bacterium]
MSEDLSRRGFLAGLTAGGTALALETAGGDAVVQPVHPRVEVPPTGGTIKILLAAKLAPDEVERIRSAGRSVEVVVPRDSAETLAAAAEAEVILGEPSAEAIRAAKRLKWVQHWAAGVERLPPVLTQHPCVLTNMQRVFAPVIAETAFALLLGLTRGLVQASVPNFRLRKWDPAGHVPLDDLYQKTLGVVGLGGIGTEVARRAHDGFGMKVLAVDPKPMPKPEIVAELREPAWLPEMVPQVDVLVSCAPHTRETAKLFGEDVFRAMRKTAYFINVSRGALVDQEALAHALQGGWIRGAGLDVTTPEPLPPEDPLWDCPNLVITPHNSGSAPVRQVRLVALVAENVRRYSNGLALLNVVDKQRGY